MDTNSVSNKTDQAIAREAADEFHDWLLRTIPNPTREEINTRLHKSFLAAIKKSKENSVTDGLGSHGKIEPPDTDDISRKVTVLDAANQMLRGLVATRDILECNGNAKAAVGSDWNRGYEAAMQDSVKQINSLIDEIEDMPIPPATPSTGDCTVQGV